MAPILIVAIKSFLVSALIFLIARVMGMTPVPGNGVYAIIGGSCLALYFLVDEATRK